MKKQLLSVFAALALGTGWAQTSISSWSISQNTSFTLSTGVGVRYLDAVDPNVVWMTGYDGSTPGLNYNWFSRTINGGATYNTGNIFPDTNTYVISNISGVDANTCWVAAFTKSLQAQGAIYKTTNGGSSWANVTPAGMFTNTAAFADVVNFFDANNGVVLGDPVGGEFELWTTSNGGGAWTMVPAANIPNPLSGEFGIINLFDKQGTTNMWFGTNKGRIYYTTNSGLNWNVSSVTSTPNTSTVTEIAFASATNGLAFVAVGTTNPVQQLYSTTNGGATWSLVNTTDPDLGQSDLAGIPGTTYFASAGANFNTPNLTISYSTDNGLTWLAWDGPTAGTQQYLNVDFVDANHGWAGAFSTSPTQGGIFKYDGATANFSFAPNVCRTGATVTVSPLSNLSWGTGGVTYTWSAPASVAVAGANTATPVLTFSSNAVYVVTLAVTNTLGVVSTATQGINVLTCTSPTANFNIPTSVCNNVTFLFTNTSTGSPSPTFSVSTSAASGVTMSPVNSSNTVSIVFSAPGVYSITSNASSIYGSSATTKTINVLNCAPAASFTLSSVQLCVDAPSTSTVLAGNTTTVLAGSPTVSYNWIVTPSATSFTNTGTSRKFTFAANTPNVYTITLVATNASGTTTAVNTLTASICAVGIAEISNLENSISVYPNPAHEQLNIALPANNNGTYTVKLVNIVGTVVYEEKNTKDNVTINLANKAKGVYFLSVEANGDKAVKKIVIE